MLAKNIFPIKFNEWTKMLYNFEDQLFMKSPRNNCTGCIFFMSVQNADFAFQHAHLKCLTGSEDILFYNNFRNPKILHVVCLNPSQIDITKTLQPFQAVIICLPVILNTVLQIVIIECILNIKRKYSYQPTYLFQRPIPPIVMEKIATIFLKTPGQNEYLLLQFFDQFQP